MKTPNLDKLIADTEAAGESLMWYDGKTVEHSLAEVAMAVSEDIREACERAWLEGYHAPDGSYDKNPYRKVGR